MCTIKTYQGEFKVTFVHTVINLNYKGTVVTPQTKIGTALESVKNGVLPVVDNIETGKNAKAGKLLGTDFYGKPSQFGDPLCLFFLVFLVFNPTKDNSM